MKLNEIFIKVVDIISEIEPNIEKTTLTQDTNLSDLDDWDSLNSVTFEMNVEEKFNIELDTGALEDIEKIEEIVEFIQKKIDAI